MSIYEQLAKLRDEISSEDNGRKWEQRAYALQEIAAQAFLNECNKDQIPQCGVSINDCYLSEKELIELFSKLGIKISYLEVIEEFGDRKSYDIIFDN